MIKKIIILVFVSHMAFALQADVKSFAIKGAKWVPAMFSAGLIGAATHNLLAENQSSFLNRQCNFGAIESLCAGSTYLFFSGLKYAPKVGKYLDNNVGYYALISLLVSRTATSMWLANIIGHEGWRELVDWCYCRINGKRIYEAQVIAPCQNNKNRFYGYEQSEDELARFLVWGMGFGSLVVGHRSYVKFKNLYNVMKAKRWL